MLLCIQKETLELKCLRDTAGARMSWTREMSGWIHEAGPGKPPKIAAPSPLLMMAHCSKLRVAGYSTVGSTYISYANEMRCRGWELRTFSGSNRHEVYMAALNCGLQHVFRSLAIAIKIVQNYCVFGRERIDFLYPRGAPTLVSPSNGCTPASLTLGPETSPDPSR